MPEHASTKSIISRPLDLIYFLYFATHIPIALCIDFQVFYPPSWVPLFLREVLRDFVETYKDPFMGSKTRIYWFQSFMVIEVVLQLPFFFVACYHLAKNSSHIRLPLAVYGAHVATTVLPTLTEVLLNPTLLLTTHERWKLAGFYLPYFIVPLIMLIDSYRRVSRALSLSQTRSKTE